MKKTLLSLLTVLVLLTAVCAPALAETAEERPDIIGTWERFYTEEEYQSYISMFVNDLDFTLAEAEEMLNEGSIYYVFYDNGAAQFITKDDESMDTTYYTYSLAPGMLIFHSVIDWSDYDMPEWGIEIYDIEYEFELEGDIMRLTMDEITLSYRKIA
ncbi:MAG: hypothetical protein CW338_02155 [Clostridiales bacterium]|nr:hypothetical protein [Clostridiales bacterium]